jgi:hypothetical protein
LAVIGGPFLVVALIPVCIATYATVKAIHR